MLGHMQVHPLLLSSILEHVEATYAAKPLYSRELPSVAGEVGKILKVTWGDAALRARQVATLMWALDIKQGERVATIAWNTHRHLELYYGVAAMGSILHTINPRLTLQNIQFMINDAQDKAVFYDGTFIKIIEALKPLCPTVKHWIQLSIAPEASSSSKLDASYESAIEDLAPMKTFPAFDENTAAALCYTSGTTGNPKGVLYSHRSLVLESMAAVMPDALCLSRADVIAPVVPMFHVNAWSLPFAAGIVGASLALPGYALSGDALFDFFEQTRTTVSAGVPTIWQNLLDHMDVNSCALKTMKRTIIGGSAVQSSMIKHFRDSYNIEVIHGWGMTETSPIGTVNALTPEEASDLPSEAAADILIKQGRYPFGVKLRIEDENGHTIPPGSGTAGKLWVQGHWVISKYYNATDLATVNNWFDTGDIATIDDAMVMQITDRDKDIIKSGGEWISSIELEGIALKHPNVAQAAAIAVAHPKWDERPLVVVIAKPGKPIEPDHIKEHFKPHVAGWQVPEIIEIDEMPIGATGKILKIELRQRFADFFNQGS